ncbi:MAG: multicopper oxidase domain-containing protein [Luteolibacter sp.]
MKTPFAILTSILLTHAFVQARVVEYDLTISEQQMAPAGKTVSALTINGGIPGPTLRFQEGDTAVIRVHNDLKRETTSTHWHGLLLPNPMDGVPYLTTPPIKPGTTHTFRFPLKHSGTYWYHSHTGLQEQRGVYGSIVVEPKGGEPVRTDREHVLVLSDWTNRNPKTIMRSLMAGYDYDAIKKHNKQSILGAAQAGALGDYFQREKDRIPPMDLSDVYYDAFFINGKTTSRLAGKPGEKVRLRLINAGASTYFYINTSAGPMTIVAADGPPVEPVKVENLLMGIAETYDIVVTVPPSGSYEIRATAQDGSGHASVWVGEGTEHPAPEIPKANLYKMDYMLAGAFEALGDAPDSERPLPPYRQLRALKSTVLPKDAPSRTVELRLTGDMERYIWSFNGKTLSEDSTIKVKKGEVVRFELVNDTMMHHPIHLHGHFFRLINGQGDRSPLKHTVDVPPMGKRTIEFEANDEGDWFFHCHLLYHMDAGMARVVSYETEDPNHVPSIDPALNAPYYWMISGLAQNNMSMGMAKFMNERNDFGLMWDVGYGSGMDHMGKDYEYEADVFWSRYFNPNFSTLLGYRFTNDEDSEDRFIGGVRYRLPGLVWTGLTLDSEGDARLEVTKALQLTQRLAFVGNAEYDTNTGFDWYAGLDYAVVRNFGLTVGYDGSHGFGGGISFRF